MKHIAGLLLAVAGLAGLYVVHTMTSSCSTGLLALASLCAVIWGADTVNSSAIVARKPDEPA